VSIIRFRPLDWLRKTNRGAAVLNGAHRGGASLGPENTLITALLGYLAGADFWELDVQLSFDQQLVVLHDDTLERTANAAAVFPEHAPWQASTFRWGEIRRLDCGSWFASQQPLPQSAGGPVPANAAADLTAAFIGANAPSLLEALLLTRGLNWRVNVEIKDQGGGRTGSLLVDRVVKLIEALKMTERVLVSSFNHGYLERVRGLDPALATGVLLDQVPADPAALVAELDADALHPPATVIDPAMIEELKARRIAVNVWTVNEAPSMRQLIAAGVTGIITDCPQVLKRVREAGSRPRSRPKSGYTG